MGFKIDPGLRLTIVRRPRNTPSDVEFARMKVDPDEYAEVAQILCKVPCEWETEGVCSGPDARLLVGRERLTAGDVWHAAHHGDDRFALADR